MSSETQQIWEAQWLQTVTATFREIAGDDHKINLAEFKKALQVKEAYFAERYFQYFDKDKSGEIELEEFVGCLQDVLQQDQEGKLRFLFQLFDDNGDGTISRDELRLVIGACVSESELKLDDSQLHMLVDVLIKAVDKDGDGVITFEELSEQFGQYPELVANLSISPANWLKVKKKKKIKSSECLKTIKRYTSLGYIKNNLPLVVFLIIYVFLNVGLFLLNCFLYRKSNWFIILARGSGMCLNFNGALLVVCMLRRSLTWLRCTRVGSYLPLDSSIPLHKMAGYVLTAATIFHTLMHLINIGVVAGKPLPGNHKILAYWEILLTPRAEIGWAWGLAYITGWLLVIILFVMVACSLNVVRASGYFQVFYWSHMLYWLFWILFLLHARHFWIWFLIPGLIFIIEKVLDRIDGFKQSRSSKFFIERANLMRPRVTHLVISRPRDFTFNAGDYVFLNIPDLASFEWHPFTISSAPELEDVLWLHIRSLGNWTGKLHGFYTNLKKKNIEADIEKTVQSVGDDIFAAVATPNVAMPDSMCSTDKGVISISDHRKIYLRGPYGTPAHEFTRTEHAVLVAAGIGVTPCASLLQSLLIRRRRIQSGAMQQQEDFKLKKVDFVWVNRHVADFEWFLMLLTQLEVEDAQENSLQRFLATHLYLTAAKTKDDMKGVGLQMALELIHQKEKRDLLTGLKTRMQPGRPDWNSLFRSLKEEKHGHVHVFFCGSAALANVVKSHCVTWDFAFSHSF